MNRTTPVSGRNGSLRPAVFLDRDGVLVANVFYEDSGLWEAPRTPDRCVVYPWVAEALRLFRDAGYELIVVSNQPNAALGKSTREEMEETHQAMVQALSEQGVALTGSYYCLHHPRALDAAFSVCSCRKPSPQMVLDAAAAHAIDLARSWIVGDRSSDIECGRRAGLRTLRIAPDHPVAARELEAIEPDDHAENLLEAAHRILKV